MKFVRQRVDVRNAENVIFVDEAIFSTGSYRGAYWSLPGQRFQPDPLFRYDQRTIAALGAVSAHHGLILLRTKERSIKAEDFADFLVELSSKVRGENPESEVVVFLDNASIHRSYKVKAKASELGVELLFNAPRRPEFNAIEGVWGLCKSWYRK